ncbi:MAG: prolipoprotein diacylglyceryl transferase [Gammaproteobacteria bacterium]|jgi:prolipoprotein diacylglyceryltransferase|nr:prolipoprotein diacylglyceryl transferase [Gammaproteobacteria bacterium]
MNPSGLFGLDALRALLSPVAVFGILFFILYLRNEGVRALRATILLLAVAVVALLGAKLFSLHVRGWELYEPLHAELRGGWRYPGALIAMVLLGPVLQRLLLPGLPLGRFLDVLAITVCFCFALIRISCLMNGCCTGPQCDAFYCLSYEPGSAVWYHQLKSGLLANAAHPSHPVLPLHLLFMLASFCVGLFLLWFDGRRRYNGQVALMYLFLHDGAKGVLETFREPYFLELQMTSLGVSALGLAGLLFFRWRFAAGRSASAL